MTRINQFRSQLSPAYLPGHYLFALINSPNLAKRLPIPHANALALAHVLSQDGRFAIRLLLYTQPNDPNPPIASWTYEPKPSLQRVV